MPIPTQRAHLSQFTDYDADTAKDCQGLGLPMGVAGKGITGRGPGKEDYTLGKPVPPMQVDAGFQK